MVVGWLGLVACRIILSAPALSSGLWIWYLDLGLDLGLTIKVIRSRRVFPLQFPIHLINWTSECFSVTARTVRVQGLALP